MKIKKNSVDPIDKDGFPIIDGQKPELWPLLKLFDKMIKGKISSNKQMRRILVQMVKEFDRMIEKEEKIKRRIK